MIKRVILTLVLFVFVIALVFIRDIAGGSIPLKEIQLPANTTYTLRMNTGDFWKDEAYAMLFQNDDKGLEVQLKEWAKKRQDRENLSTGIDPQGDVLVFGFSYQKKSFTGISVAITDEEAFQSNASKLFPFPVATSTKAGRGTIVFFTDRGQNKIPLQRVLAQCQSGKVHQFEPWKEDNTFEFNFTDPHQTTEQLHLVGKIKTDVFQIDGTYKTAATPLPQDFTLTPKHFHVHVGSIPTRLQPSITTLLKQYLPFAPAVSSLSVNYNGTVLDDERINYLNTAGFSIQPEMEMVLQFEGPVRADSIRAKIPSAYLKSESSNEGWDVVQLSNRSVYIGATPHHARSSKNTAILLINGQLSTLLQLKGASTGAQFAINFLHQMEPFRSLKQFSNASEKTQLSIVPTGKKGIYAIQGKLSMKSGKNAHIELLRMVMSYSSL